MTPGYGWILRLIPLVMLTFCVAFGGYVADTGDPKSVAGEFIAGHVLVGLAAICLALFCTAAVLVSNLLHRFTPVKWAVLPALGYVGAIATAAYGIGLWVNAPLQEPWRFITGHIVFGVACIAGCVSTVALASGRFPVLIRNGRGPAASMPETAYQGWAAAILYFIPSAIAAGAWAVAIPLLASAEPPRLVAGLVLFGLAAICTSVVALLVSVVRQEQGSYTTAEGIFWPLVPLAMGLGCICLGVLVLATKTDPLFLAPGWVLPGLGLICFSVLSKVWLLAVTWRRETPWAVHIPLLPTFTALGCLFIAAFLFQAGVTNDGYFIAARVVAGLGAICFTLFSIVSLLESGTSG